MNQLINNLISHFRIEDIEKSLIQFFVLKNSIRVKKNKLISAALNDNNTKTIKINKLLNDSINKFTLNDLESAFELLIPVKDRKINGAFFTPSFITNFISSELIKSEKQIICDPSCGCGAFLVSAIKIFKTKFNKQIIPTIENFIFGADVLDYSIRRCKIILTLFALLNNEDKEEISFNIFKQDSLNVDWKARFPHVMQKGGFDIIIGNPPYVKYQDLPYKIRKELYHNWSTLKTGTYNLYFAFFELGISLLNAKGKLGYITPNNYFTSLAGVHLREFLHHNQYIDKIIDFNHLKVFEAQTYTCITFLSKTKKDFFLFERIEDRKKMEKLPKLKFSKIKYSKIDNRKWRLLREIDQENIKKIETIGIPLGALVNIRVGIATCKDNIYFIDAHSSKNGYFIKEFNGKKFLIEKSITRPIDKISDFNTQQDLDKNTRRIIFPYVVKNGKAFLIKKNELKEKYPNCFEYFMEVKEILNQRDKGKVNYEEWYAYARSQGLASWGEKILTPTFSRQPRFLHEKKLNALFCNGYGIFIKNNDFLFNNFSLEVLLKIVNSKIMEYYINQTSVSIEGGYPCYQKNFIERFALPNFEEQEMYYLKHENKKDEIEEFLIKKYDIKI